MPVIPTQNYADIRPQLKTGDILSFEGSEGLDVLINLMEGGGYSHVGIVLRDAEDNLWFWDAPGNDIEFPDPYNKNAMHSGTRVANLDNLLEHYVTIMNITGFSWCQLTPNNPIDYAALVTWITANDGLPFPGDGAAFPLWFTELIAKVYPHCQPSRSTNRPGCSSPISPGASCTSLPAAITSAPSSSPQPTCFSASFPRVLYPPTATLLRSSTASPVRSRSRMPPLAFPPQSSGITTLLQLRLPRIDRTPYC